jgi:hypothetical protein
MVNDRLSYKVDNSSCISGFGYNEKTKILTVEFLHGGRYDYPDIEKKIVSDWISAESKGKYFNRVIRPLGKVL